MYLGKIVEYADVREIFHNPLHPYTGKLLKAIPRSEERRANASRRLKEVSRIRLICRRRADSAPDARR